MIGATVADGPRRLARGGAGLAGRTARWCGPRAHRRAEPAAPAPVGHGAHRADRRRDGVAQGGRAGHGVRGRLYELLGAVAPERVLVPLAMDARAAGYCCPTAACRSASARGRELVEALAGRWGATAQLQLALAPHTDRLLAPASATCAQRYAAALRGGAAPAAGRRGAGATADRRALERAAAMGEQVARVVRAARAAPGATSLDHNDLHPWNVLVGDGGRRALLRLGRRRRRAPVREHARRR